MTTNHDPAAAAVVQRFLDEVVNAGRLDLIDELWSPDLAWHAGSLGDLHGIDAYKRMAAANAVRAFTGMHLTTDEVIAIDGKVVVRFTNSGTQSGEFFGVPASGKYAEWLGIGIYTVRDGKVTEGWFAEDILGMLLQLDAIALPTSASED